MVLFIFKFSMNSLPTSTLCTVAIQRIKSALNLQLRDFNDSQKRGERRTVIVLNSVLIRYISPLIGNSRQSYHVTASR